jgi:hypothetical protein
VQYLSIRDLIMHMCNTSNDYAGDFLVPTSFEIFSRTSNEVRDFFPNLKRGSRFFPEPLKNDQVDIFFHRANMEELERCQESRAGCIL